VIRAADCTPSRRVWKAWSLNQRHEHKGRRALDALSDITAHSVLISALLRWSGRTQWGGI